jgi:hypothetical protein
VAVVLLVVGVLVVFSGWDGFSIRADLD